MADSTPRRRRRTTRHPPPPPAPPTTQTAPAPPAPTTQTAPHPGARKQYTALYPINRNGTVIPRGKEVEFADDEAGHARALAKVGVVMEGEPDDARVRERVARLNEAERRRGL